MSKIDQLSIQGIRNFGPDVAEIIAFEPPVTLILGKNGSGKTTIIESLKYATTGEMPAGTNRGQSFIHDPKLTSRHMSIGNVKLQFFDERGNKFIVSRSMEARLLKSKMEFKTSDATITSFDSDGKPKSVKNKNNDVNTFVCNMLGVSKALLNNVLFCHQEDSNWPLDEAKKVKDKFDDIFNTTRYVKCQDEIRKQIMDVKAKIKDIERSVEHYKMLKEQAESFQSDVRKQTERKTILEKEMAQMEKERQDLEGKSEELHEKYREAEKVQQDIQAKKMRLEELERNRMDLESDITRRLMGTAEELEIEMKKFQSTKSERKAELDQYQQDFQRQENRLKEAAASQQDCLVELGKLRSEEEQHLRRIKDRNNLLIRLAASFQWPGNNQLRTGSPLSSEQVTQYRNLLQQTAEKAKKEESELREQLEIEEKQLLESLNQFREQCVRLEQDIKSKEANLLTNRRELSEVEEKLRDMEESSRLMSGLEKDLAAAQALYDETEKGLDINKLQEDIANLKKQRSECQSELETLRQQLNLVMSQRDIRVKLEMHQKELTARKTQERRLLSRANVEEAIQLLLGGTPSENLLSDFNSRLNATVSNLAQEQQKITALGKETVSTEADIRNTRSHLEAKRSEFTGHQKKLSDLGISSASELESEIKRLERDLEALEDQRGMIYGSEKTIVHYIDKMEKHRSNACPLCHREFHEADETLELIQELKTSVEQMPAKLTDLDKKIKEKKDKNSSLVQLRPVAQSMAKLQADEIPQLEKKLNALESKLSSTKNQLRQREESIEFLKCEEDVGKNAQPDIVQLDATRAEIKKLQGLVDKIQKELSSSNIDGNLTVEGVQAQVDSAQSTYEETQREIEEKMEQQSQQQNKLARLKQNVNQLTARKLQLTNNLQQRGGLLERQEVVTKNVKELTVDIESCKSQLQPLIHEKTGAEKAVTEAQKRRDVSLEQAREKISDLMEHVRNIRIYDDHVGRWVSDGKDAQLRRSQADVDRLEAEKGEMEESIKALRRKISDLVLTLNNSENEERNLRNNIRLIAVQKEKCVIDEEVKNLRVQHKELNVDQVVREIRSLQERLERGGVSMGEKRGRLQEIIKAIDELEQRLVQDQFATAEDQFYDQIKDYEIHCAVSEDLQQFYTALEWALMKFHKERMSVINNMVREMWYNTYKGKDIDYIEIKAEETSSIGANSRRQYNYRVVMHKNGVEMDMRGRCSAGQKVLASLIIRMALAEAFSSKCGVLALDEPTTNLDEDNIASLSDTILELSSAITRQKRKFQLIIITHDEKFLDRMSRDKRMEKYYRVDRNRHNLSEITQWDVSSSRSSREMLKKK